MLTVKGYGDLCIPKTTVEMVVVGGGGCCSVLFTDVSDSTVDYNPLSNKLHYKTNEGSPKSLRRSFIKVLVN